jgi:predicted CXXCH cytochrome family protein
VDDRGRPGFQLPRGTKSFGWFSNLGEIFPLNTRTIHLLVGATAVLAIGGLAPNPAYAFHDGGSSSCAICHIMHASDDGQVVIVESGPLLLAASSSDLCLTCHDQDTVFGMDPLNPPPERGAGNFVFLLEDNINDAPDGQSFPIGGEAAGHSIISLDRATAADTRFQEAPGGIFPSSDLGCTSCHDPHGNSNFRMLNGTGPVQGGIADFTNPAPAAVGLDISNPLAVEANDQHTAYLAGMSAWCANCHGAYHDNHFNSNFNHTGDESLGNAQINIYNRYNGDNDPLGGTQGTAYLKDVPFEQPGSSTSSTFGPTAGSRIMCLSCHRAHASSSPAATRWDMRIVKLDLDGEVSGSYPTPNPYPGPFQGPLCRKCHPKGSIDPVEIPHN